MIKVSDLRTDMPKSYEQRDGCINTILALRNSDMYCESNTYIPQWDSTTAAYYIRNHKDFIGWIKLEEVLLPREFWDLPIGALQIEDKEKLVR